MISLPLEFEFLVVRLKLYLEKHPEKAVEIAIQNYEDFLALSIEHNKVKTKLSLISASQSNSHNSGR